MPAARRDSAPDHAAPPAGPPRRPTRRAAAAARRAELIAAMLDAIAEGGLSAATLRAVADRAGVSNGLIRHHFSGKEPLVVAAYEATVARLTAPGQAVLDAPGLAPDLRLARFVAANLGGAVVDGRLFTLWASFLATVHVDAAMAAVHRRGYLDYRTRIEPLIAAMLAAAGRDAGAAPAMATQVNALLDGLWLEGCLLPADFPPGELERLGIEGTARIIGLPLPLTAAGAETEGTAA